MLAVMMGGMIVSAAVLLSFVGLKTWEEVTTQYGTQALITMALGTFLCLVWFGVTRSAQCGGYCAVTVAAMLGLMVYRRREYSAPVHTDGTFPRTSSNR